MGHKTYVLANALHSLSLLHLVRVTALADAQCVLLDSMTTLTFTHGLQKPVGASGLRVGAECNGKYANRSGKDNPYRRSHDPPQSKPPPWELSPSPGYISGTRS